MRHMPPRLCKYILKSLGTVTTVQNLKKKKKEDKVPHQNGTVDEQWKTLYEQCENTIGALALLDIRKKTSFIYIFIHSLFRSLTNSKI